MAEFGTGLAIGKFLPPHRGHKHLISTARERCERVTVLCCVRPDDPIAGEKRIAWLREIHPDCEIVRVEDTLGPDDTLGWAENTIRILGRPPDAVFTSEAYGDPYAAAMGCRHVAVDPPRQRVPISATRVRSAPLAEWRFLEPCVRAYYAVRVIVLGAESTGTTTLALALARRFDADYVAEYGRDYPVPTAWRTEDFVRIATEQAARENRAAREGNGVVVGDTDAFATSVWHWRYRGFRSPEVEAIRPEHPATFTFLTGDEIPFVQDGTRDGESIRHAMHDEFARRLREAGRPFTLLRGSPETRLEAAVKEIAPRLEQLGRKR